jgi:hypothetical protein
MATAITTTTLSAAMNATTRVATPASMTGIEVGDLLFIGREAMQVQVVGTSTVTVQRGMAGTTAAAHVSADRIYHGPTNQFQARDPVGTDAAQYTPWINTLNGSIWSQTGARNSVWRRADEGGRGKRPVYEYTEPGAITVAEGLHVLNGDGADAFTLAAPSVDQDGMRMVVISNAAQAFVVTATTLFRGDSGGTDDTTATYSDIGDSMELIAYAGKWLVINSAVGAAASGVVFT